MICPHCGKNTDRAECFNCGKEILYDISSGYWIHAGFEKVDGRNGLYCSPEMWDNPETRVYTRPKKELNET